VFDSSGKKVKRKQATLGADLLHGVNATPPGGTFQLRATLEMCLARTLGTCRMPLLAFGGSVKLRELREGRAVPVSKIQYELFSSEDLRSYFK
jgi:hypothetical protein